MCSNPIFLDLTFLELCLHYKTIKKQPMDTFCLQLFLEGGGRGVKTPLGILI